MMARWYRSSLILATTLPLGVGLSWETAGQASHSSQTRACVLAAGPGPADSLFLSLVGALNHIAGVWLSQDASALGRKPVAPMALRDSSVPLARGVLGESCEVYGARSERRGWCIWSTFGDGLQGSSATDARSRPGPRRLWGKRRRRWCTELGL